MMVGAKSLTSALAKNTSKAFDSAYFRACRTARSVLHKCAPTVEEDRASLSQRTLALVQEGEYQTSVSRVQNQSTRMGSKYVLTRDVKKFMPQYIVILIAV